MQQAEAFKITSVRKGLADSTHGDSSFEMVEGGGGGGGGGGGRAEAGRMKVQHNKKIKIEEPNVFQ